MQTLEQNHPEPPGAAIDILGTSERRILSRHTESGRLVTGGAIGRENLFAFFRGCQFRGLFAATAGTALAREPRRAAEVVESVATEISRITTEIGAAKKDGHSIDRDQPKRERLPANARLGFFPNDGGMGVADLLGFVVIHSLTRAVFGRWAVHFVASLAGAAAMVGGGLASFNGCD